MNSTWILIGDASRARVFATNGKGRPWTLVRELAHPESRLKGREIMSDKPGRVQQSMGAKSRPGMEPPTSPKEVEAGRFAENLAHVLEEGHGHNAYARVILVAPPHFLGLLRRVISTQVSKRVSASLDKDLTELKEHELPGRLADLL
jgi:protein required for attachment to host cells